MTSRQVFFLINKFTNHLMVNGSKIKAENLFVRSFFLLKNKGESPIRIFLQALENSKPSVELRSVRRGGASYQIPVPLSEKRRISLSMKWVIEVARRRKNFFSGSLAEALIEASKSRGDSVKKKNNVHTIALKNRSLTHFRWF